MAFRRGIGRSCRHADGSGVSGNRREGARGKPVDLWYSGRKHRYGANIQAMTLPGGFPIWISDAEPGSVRDISAARIHALPALCHAATVLKCPRWPTPGTKAPGRESTSRSGITGAERTPGSISATALITPSCALCAA